MFRITENLFEKALVFLSQGWEDLAHPEELLKRLHLPVFPPSVIIYSASSDRLNFGNMFPMKRGTFFKSKAGKTLNPRTEDPQ